MIEVTPAAIEQINTYFEGREVMPLRVFLSPGGCSGPALALALDEPNDKDDIFKIDGHTFVVESAFLKQAAPIKIDFASMGFRIDSSIELGAGGCGSCSGSCGV